MLKIEVMTVDEEDASSMGSNFGAKEIVEQRSSALSAQLG